MEHYTVSEKGLAGSAMEEGRSKKLEPLPANPGGYVRLAQHMGEHSNRAIFRRFGDLNALSLLLLQAELVELERKLLGEAAQDAKSSTLTPQHRSLEWRSLRDAIEADGSKCAQLNTLLEVREVLKEYSKLQRLSSQQILITTKACVLKIKPSSSKVLHANFRNRISEM